MGFTVITLLHHGLQNIAKNDLFIGYESKKNFKLLNHLPNCNLTVCHESSNSCAVKPSDEINGKGYWISDAVRYNFTLWGVLQVHLTKGFSSARSLFFILKSHHLTPALHLVYCGQDWDESTCSEHKKALRNMDKWSFMGWGNMQGKVQSDVTNLACPSGNTDDRL